MEIIRNLDNNYEVNDIFFGFDFSIKGFTINLSNFAEIYPKPFPLFIVIGL